jgi:hypothetical protein
MSWKSGGGIFYEIILTLKETVPEYQTRVDVYSKLIEIFKEHDCDTLYECLDEDLAFDDADVRQRIHAAAKDYAACRMQCVSHFAPQMSMMREHIAHEINRKGITRPSTYARNDLN